MGLGGKSCFFLSLKRMVLFGDQGKPECLDRLCAESADTPKRKLTLGKVNVFVILSYRECCGVVFKIGEGQPFTPNVVALVALSWRKEHQGRHFLGRICLVRLTVVMCACRLVNFCLLGKRCTKGRIRNFVMG